MKTVVIIFFLLLCQYSYSQNGIIIDHRHTDISLIPNEYITAAKNNLKIRYFRRSHGSQVDMGGMAALRRYSTNYANKFNYNKTGAGGALLLSTQVASEPWNSLDFENATWVQITRSYLNNPANAQINVVMWAWSSNFYLCNAQQYLNDMETLIAEYGPGGSKNRPVPVLFVFQTACGQKSSSRNKKVFEGNKLIRNHCITHNRILFDFNDLETYNPDGAYFGDANSSGNYTNIRLLNDDLAYISNNPGGSVHAGCRNWGIDWMQSHPTAELTKLAANDKCTTCAHSEGSVEGETKDNSRLHCVLKGRAAWYLWATLAGWNNQQENQNPIANANGAYTALVNQAINFSSAGSSDPDGNIVSYRWSFGDGTTSTQANPVHTFSSEATYAVSLTVIDNEGASGINNTTANVTSSGNLPPIVNSNGPYQAAIGEEISFSSAGSSDPDGNIVSYLWDFGNRNSSTLANPKYTYSAAGNYTVSLTLVDNDGASTTSTTTATITEGSANSSPIADANGPYTSLAGVAINFSSAGSFDPDGSIISYRWSFGGRATSNLPNPVYTYPSAGNYKVTLTVTDNDGATNTQSTVANVSLNTGTRNPILDPEYFEMDVDNRQGIINNSSIKSKTEKLEVNSNELKTKDFQLYPNPVTDIINIVTRVDEPTTAEIYTANGHLIKTQRLQNSRTSIDISNLMSGIYFIKISSEEVAAYKMFLKNQ